MITIGFFGVLLIGLAIFMLIVFIKDAVDIVPAWISFVGIPLFIGIVFVTVQCNAEYVVKTTEKIIVVTEDEKSSDLDCGVWKVQISQEISDTWYISNREAKRKILEQIKKCEDVKTFTTQEK